MSAAVAQAQAPVGVLGGTFDPVHYGHLRPALELLQDLSLRELRLIPGRIPPHRGAPLVASAERLELLQAAVADIPGLTVDDRELHRDGPSYTVDTLVSLRRELGTRPVCFALGADAFLGLPTWHRWREIAEHAHLVVMGRPGHEICMAPVLRDWATPRVLRRRCGLRRRAGGGVWFHPVSQLDISATEVRRLMAQGRSARCLMPEAVWRRVAGDGLYGYPQV